MSKPPAIPRKMPTQSRSRVTVEVILEAAAHILATKGYEAFTTNRVAERAGVSIGSLYQYFPNKQSLLAALHARHIDEIKSNGTAIVGEAEKCSLSEAIAHLIQNIVESHVASDRLHQVVATETPDSMIKASTPELIRRLLDSYRPILTVEDPDLAAYIISVTIKAVVHGALHDRPDELREGKIEKNLTRLLLPYLTGEKP
ncbi:TetR/AcrR family transcriptional regulator [Georgfuchsia toluolica]|uniref:TetR/AcrR family transcriptional regulator n=1 Tax=Georgfuchsia toluolica TaxID=424218 RepID=A0A916NGY2_9PROT|nr:TetR/AcrR family transcriptional regulator [Georgfuchsia toluolica]CAG4882729.1 TetR/AcrR family transcriptional regulator [Georgfuchsia toluolica]